MTSSPHWIALQWPPEAAAPQALAAGALAADALSPEALAWWALRFTPHVAWVDEALLLEVSGTLRLWGGRRALRHLVFEQNPLPALASQAQGATSLIALARLRLRALGQPGVARAADLPLHTLSAARLHLPLLSQLGCRTWGDLLALPRAGLARRFGPALGQALDVALGRAPDAYAWAALPERFDQRLELPSRVDDAPALLWAANRLLASLQLWLQARQLGVLAIALGWRLDVRRLNGQDLPPTQSLTLRTAQPVQHMEHLRRLLAEQLAHTAMLAPAIALNLRALHTAPWCAGSHSLLPEDRRQGEPLHVFIERVSARLGADQLLSAEPVADHRPECRQRWRPAQAALAGPGAPGASAPAAAPAPTASAARRPPPARRVRTDAATAAGQAVARRPAAPPAWPDGLAPTHLLPEPLPLAVHGAQPHYHGPLRLLTEPRRIDAGWWPADETSPGDAGLPGQGAAARQISRDYFIAQNPRAELLWVFHERPTSARPDAAGEPARWFLHGLYA